MNGGLIFEALLIVFCVFLLQTRETEHPVHHCIVDRAYCYSGNKQCPQRNLPYSWWYGHIQPPFYCPDRHLNSPSVFIHSVGFSFGRIWSLWSRFTNEDRAVHFRIFPTSCWFWEVHRGKQLISCAEYYSDGGRGVGEVVVVFPSRLPNSQLSGKCVASLTLASRTRYANLPCRARLNQRQITLTITLSPVAPRNHSSGERTLCRSGKFNWATRSTT